LVVDGKPRVQLFFVELKFIARHNKEHMGHQSEVLLGTCLGGGRENSLRTYLESIKEQKNSKILTPHHFVVTLSK
jgi:hypothetical protein